MIYEPPRCLLVVMLLFIIIGVISPIVLFYVSKEAFVYAGYVSWMFIAATISCRIGSNLETWYGARKHKESAKGNDKS